MHCAFGLPEKPLFVSEEIGLREWNISAIGTVSQQIVSFCGFKNLFTVYSAKNLKSFLNFLLPHSFYFLLFSKKKKVT